MKKRKTMAGAVLLAAAAVALIVSSSASAASDGQNRRHRAVLLPAVYVFGDSLVDVGNNDFLPPPAPQAGFPCGIDLPPGSPGRRTGRFTNGYNLADFIAQRVGFNMSPPAYLSLTPQVSLDLLSGRVGANYASGGSGILDATGNGTITLREQIKFFANTKASMTKTELGHNKVNRLLSRSLFIISTAGNDFSAFSYGRANMSDALSYIANMISTYLTHIKVLYNLGARRLGLLDAVPIGCLPGSRASSINDGPCNDASNSLAQHFNTLLRLEMASATAASMPGMEYSIASVYNIISDMISNPPIDGLEVSNACCGGGRLNAEVSCSATSNLCTDRSRYVFWDNVHETQAAYQRAVAAMFEGTAAAMYTEPITFQQLVTQKQVAPGAGIDLDHSSADLAAEI
ncbi:hypothetical protein QYE76_001743 [Lolium multiflorum]|uniref:GDSL esterase/lipase n=1 Tax=Lolium multiflorum TaxID=4521 RepID=A0AAD8RLY1_LOLMU|nr:hypothetical protein QYE76_001743 [Lolium multiflorum]